MRIQRRTSRRCAAVPFLSSNAQDFIEDAWCAVCCVKGGSFLSSNAQDFIEEAFDGESGMSDYIFLSSNAQDFIEDPPKP